MRLLLLLCFASPALAQPRLATAPASSEAPAPFLAGDGLEYAYDDGAANTNIGPPSSFDPDMLWGNYFYTESGAEVITEIAVAFGPTFPSGGPVTFWLLDDPDADGDPRNAAPLTSTMADPDVSGNTFFRVAIPPTPVSGAFFVGASAVLEGGQDRPARADTDARADRSWFFYDGSIANVIDDLGGAAFGTRMDDPTNVPFPGAFMVRAIGQPIATDTEDAPEIASVQVRVSPNPSVGPARIRLEMPRAGVVRVEVVDLLGRSLARVHQGDLAKGTHDLLLPDLAPGSYGVRAETGAGVTVERFVVVR
ncbi:MAG: T9SS type A sorting domain-containing protein [Bacteroidota bacterium]